MVDESSLIFVEVRYRKSTEYGNPLETITRNKQRKIIRTASNYLLARFNSHDIPCRFDAVGVMENANNELEFNWIKQAFY